MKSSADWTLHFEQNLKKERINWHLKPQISEEELRKIRYGLRAWQKGETSEGNHLRTAAFHYAKKIRDPQYYRAICLFIKEEQKHGANLGRYIDLVGEKRLQFDWGDHLFRKIRGLNRSMEIWTLTVIIVELAAQVFYRALKNATACPLLRQVCSDILIDEAYHIRFQQQRLAAINHNRGFLRKRLCEVIYYSFGYSISRIIWLAHAQAFKAGAVDRRSFLDRMDRRLAAVFNLEGEAGLRMRVPELRV